MGATSPSSPDRDDPHESDQLWLLDRSGGEAERVTDLPGGVSDYAWAPDGTAPRAHRRGSRSRRPGRRRHREEDPRPIVIDRFRFKADEKGYVTERRDHLYLFDLATRKADSLTPGDYDEVAPVVVAGRKLDRVREPARGPSRTGPTTSTSTSSRPRPVREPRQLTTFPGRRRRSGWGGRGSVVEPRWQAPRLRAGRSAQSDLLRHPEHRGHSGGRRDRPRILTPRTRPAGALPDLVGGRLLRALPPGGRPGLPPRQRTGRRWPGRACGRGPPGRLRSVERPRRQGRRAGEHAGRAGGDIRRRERNPAADHPPERRAGWPR